jgi:hypothetical protein
MGERNGADIRPKSEGCGETTCGAGGDNRVHKSASNESLTSK